MNEGINEQVTGSVSGHALANATPQQRIELIAGRSVELGNELGCKGFKVKSTKIYVHPKTQNVDILVSGRRKR